MRIGFLRQNLLSTSASLLALALVVCADSRVRAEESAIVPSKVVNLLANTEFTVHLNPERSLSTDPKESWNLTDGGLLHVLGKGLGYVRTNQAYRDYHLVLEFKWGEQTHGGRADRARDCGLLIHAYGEDGAFGGTWMNCIESQLIEGGTGDFLVLASQREDGSFAPTRITAEVSLDRDGEPVWTPGGEKQVFPLAGKTMARVNWKHRDPDWADVKGYRGAQEVEKPLGEWNRLEVICRGDTIRNVLNGQLINEVTACNPSSGFIGLQSELAECWIRRLELHPLDTFKVP